MLSGHRVHKAAIDHSMTEKVLNLATLFEAALSGDTVLSNCCERALESNNMRHVPASSCYSDEMTMP